MHELTDLQRAELEHLANEIGNIERRLAGFIDQADRELYEQACATISPAWRRSGRAASPMTPSHGVALHESRGRT